ncbi:MAG: flagellar export protein FliJ [Anaerolineales bacterium]
MSPEFSLQPLLNYRHNKVEAMEIQLARLIVEHRQAYNLRQAVQQGRNELLEDMRLEKKKTGPLDLDALTQLTHNLKMLDRRIAEQDDKVAALHNQIEDQRRLLVEARQEEEALSILRRKELDRFRAELNRRENAERDDIYIAPAFQRQMSEVAAQ